MYRMTAKGLSEPAMGFTGELSRVIRIRFLNAFEAVDARLEHADKTLTGQLFDLERREWPSRAKGKVGSRLMHERKREKPDLEGQRLVLQHQQNPLLPGILN